MRERVLQGGQGPLLRSVSPDHPPARHVCKVVDPLHCPGWVPSLGAFGLGPCRPSSLLILRSILASRPIASSPVSWPSSLSRPLALFTERYPTWLGKWLSKRTRGECDARHEYTCPPAGVFEPAFPLSLTVCNHRARWCPARTGPCISSLGSRWWWRWSHKNTSKRGSPTFAQLPLVAKAPSCACTSGTTPKRIHLFPFPYAAPPGVVPLAQQKSLNLRHTADFDYHIQVHMSPLPLHVHYQ